MSKQSKVFRSYRVDTRLSCYSITVSVRARLEIRWIRGQSWDSRSSWVRDSVCNNTTEPQFPNSTRYFASRPRCEGLPTFNRQHADEKGRACGDSRVEMLDFRPKKSRQGIRQRAFSRTSHVLFFFAWVAIEDAGISAQQALFFSGVCSIASRSRWGNLLSGT